MRKIISMMLVIILLVLPIIPNVTYGQTGHSAGCPNTGYDTNCCTKTFSITPKAGYRIVDVLVNGISQGIISSYTFSNAPGTQTLKVITEKDRDVEKLSSFPEFTYKDFEGNELVEGVDYEIIDDGLSSGVQNWRIKFKTDGRLTFTKVVDEIDVFLVGGGGAGSNNGSGGGGGYTNTVKQISVEENSAYDIEIGEGGTPITDATGERGETTRAFGHSAAGGYGGAAWNKGGGGNGGSGGGASGGKQNVSTKAAGAGGSDGGEGESSSYWYGGHGQGTTTREFGEVTGDLYAGGGGGTGSVEGSGGSGGGGNSGKAGKANTGGGGGAAKAGGSGIVVIRNSRNVVGKEKISRFPQFTYTGEYEVIDDGINKEVQNWRIKFKTDGVLTFTKVIDEIDIFLVGGGGAGGGAETTNSGGGGGYTNTIMGIPVEAGVSYTIDIGAGGTAKSGSAGERGKTTSAFEYSAKGGYGGGNWNSAVGGGDGGSGGGATGGKQNVSAVVAGKGGSNGGNGGSSSYWSGGEGQGSTTREFGEDSGDLYAGGGGGASSAGNGTGGAGGGGNADRAGTPNTGGGGGGKIKSGGSGIVVIRNSRSAI